LAEPPQSFFSDSATLAGRLTERYLSVRNETERRAAPLSPEDQLVQSMPDASPTKWHRAHTTWFFEQFLLVERCPGYVPYHPDYAFLFNSYYVSAGPRHARNERGLLTRPGAEEVTAYRRHVDAAVVRFFHDTGENTLAGLVPLLEVGFNHEQQDQPERGHPHHRACRRQLSFRQRKTLASRAGRAGKTGAQSGQQRRMAGIHGCRRLRHADAMADGRFCRRG
jgi:hypothetical protein